MHYHLTLQKGTITLSGHIYRGSSTEAVWSPFSPLEVGGFQDGDQLLVLATFNLKPDVDPMPSGQKYVGLSAGACNATNQDAIETLKSAADHQRLYSTGALLGGITESTARADDAIFYQATSKSTTMILSGNRGTLTNYKYKWTMIFNGDNTVASGSETELVFGYGDPMIEEEKS